MSQYAPELNVPLSNQFIIPKNNDIGATLREDKGQPSQRLPQPCFSCLLQESSCTYLCGNSLGLLSERSKGLVLEELRIWGSQYVHFSSSIEGVISVPDTTTHPTPL